MKFTPLPHTANLSGRGSIRYVRGRELPSPEDVFRHRQQVILFEYVIIKLNLYCFDSDDYDGDGFSDDIELAGISASQCVEVFKYLSERIESTDNYFDYEYVGNSWWRYGITPMGVAKYRSKGQ